MIPTVVRKRRLGDNPACVPGGCQSYALRSAERESQAVPDERSWETLLKARETLLKAREPRGGAEPNKVFPGIGIENQI